MESSLDFFQVDAFTDKPFSGNPAAVFILPAPRPPRWMRAAAREMNLSETAFLQERKGGFSLRWFTPEMEVPLCGHATLAAAHVLWEEGRLRRGETARFFTRSGILTARKRAAIELDFPSIPQRKARAPEGLERALGARADYVGRTSRDYLLELRSERVLRGLRPDFKELSRFRAGGFMVTCRSETPGFDFVSRYFAPREGIQEDPVTGSAHCCLAPYWGARLGKTELTGFQASGRGGVVGVRLSGSRVLLMGTAVTVFRGVMTPAAS